jgi:alpha-tubulin suppressor-like RCC1 family protein
LSYVPARFFHAALPAWQLRMVILASLTMSAVAAGYARADSSSPLLHAFYDRFMTIAASKVYAWREGGKPARLDFKGPLQVGTGSQFYYVLGQDNTLWRQRSPRAKPLLTAAGVKSFSSGQSGLLIVDVKNRLFLLSPDGTSGRRIANDIASATVGDGANYYIDQAGGLFVKGLAHRGQYGDGRLRATKTYIRTAGNAAAVRAHTGHAILLTRNGDVLGTGGNIYGPVGKHGLGDKAIRWSHITSNMKAIATGASHSLSINTAGELFAWGSDYGPEPKKIMAAVKAVAAGSRSTIALRTDGTLWQWADAGRPQLVPLPE